MKSDSEILNIVCKVYGDGDFSEADPVVAIDAGLVSLITPKGLITTSHQARRQRTVVSEHGQPR